jgi:hypothetical protein
VLASAAPRHLVSLQAGRDVRVGHADLVAVVQHHGARQGREHEQRETYPPLVAGTPPAGEPADVMVGGHPDRARTGRQCGQRLIHHGRECRRVEAREREREVEGEVQLVTLAAVVGGQPLRVGDPGLAEQ